MSAAAHSFPVDRMSDWLEELERIMKAFDALPSAAQDAVKSVVESLVRDPDTSDAEIAHANALLARHTPHPEPGQRHRGSRQASVTARRLRYSAPRIRYRTLVADDRDEVGVRVQPSA